MKDPEKPGRRGNEVVILVHPGYSTQRYSPPPQWHDGWKFPITATTGWLGVKPAVCCQSGALKMYCHMVFKMPFTMPIHILAIFWWKQDGTLVLLDFWRCSWNWSKESVKRGFPQLINRLEKRHSRYGSGLSLHGISGRRQGCRKIAAKPSPLSGISSNEIQFEELNFPKFKIPWTTTLAGLLTESGLKWHQWNGAGTKDYVLFNRTATLFYWGSAVPWIPRYYIGRGSSLCQGVYDGWKGKPDNLSEPGSAQRRYHNRLTK